MAPCNVSGTYITGCETNRENYKLRKLMVEKMRRDRINTSIEKLKGILEKEFEKHHSSTKLEKADILEMAVSFLKKQHQLQLKIASLQKNQQMDYKEGYSRCLQETLHFLSLHEPQLETRIKLLNHFQRNAATDDGQSQHTSPINTTSHKLVTEQISSNSSKSLWRPWLI
ncbi:transcription factor HES-5-like isoform X2 [Protopterus annectens]|uniref:transcription factor HES-5-like isoform X2 n=1 Tax=Protopterus annectens TaxID=7888 RepID=UPI001CF98B69|nr:transcription factor HES-5-like isoform X2 [Protopterus annectens]